MYPGGLLFPVGVLDIALFIFLAKFVLRADVEESENKL
jgi:hypothetical protein